MGDFWISHAFSILDLFVERKMSEVGPLSVQIVDPVISPTAQTHDIPIMLSRGNSSYEDFDMHKRLDWALSNRREGEPRSRR